jgi:hypothetical protein
MKMWGANCVYYELKYCIFFEVDDLFSSGSYLFQIQSEIIILYCHGAKENTLNITLVSEYPYKRGVSEEMKSCKTSVAYDRIPFLNQR